MMKQKKVCACHNKLPCDLHHSREALVVQILFMYLHNTYHSLATDLTHAASKEDTHVFHTDYEGTGQKLPC